ncbi:cytoplasmic protein [Flagelloscypha sp. PMI_526]|nr:cytoplasmic protein [Flagelloscypha sp. PMI_526]
MSSSTRALNAILPQISTSPYEAHQKARTFASRYIKSKQYDTAIDVLFQSSRELLKTGQVGSGVDLVGFLLEAYEAKGEKVGDESRNRLTQLISLVGSEGSWRKTVIDKSIAWSIKHGDHPGGDPDLTHYIGQLLYKEGSYDLAEPHLLASGTRDSARLLAESYIHWLTATSEDPGKFALRGILPYLINGNIQAAKTFISHFASSLPSSFLEDSGTVKGSGGGSEEPEVVLTKNAVVNFCQMAVATVQRAQGDKNKVVRESWVRLCGTYQSKGGLLAESETRKLLNEIGHLYFALPLPKQQAANPFGDMLSSLLGGGMNSGSGTGPPQRKTISPST